MDFNNATEIYIKSGLKEKNEPKVGLTLVISCTRQISSLNLYWHARVLGKTGALFDYGLRIDNDKAFMFGSRCLAYHFQLYSLKRFE